MSADYKNREDQLMRRSARPMTPGQVAAVTAEELGLSQTELARRLGVSRVMVNELFDGRRALSPDMAQRLGRFFGDGAAIWMRMQATVDLWDTLHMDVAPYAEIEPLELAA